MLSKTKEKLDFDICDDASLQALNGKYLIAKDCLDKFYLYMELDNPMAGYYDTIYDALDAANEHWQKRGVE